ncbi:hypothetical protein AGLY_016600 [Aphis glycines]|uniref:Transposable element P transposase-like RNase H domain-containing protein n=1 Tax=Aphis glycines TaxID=307491 RepID=A0A6G0SXB9_APHGL|nr:hypothetical protein AGLY_016600 [Aphis glycines]
MRKCSVLLDCDAVKNNLKIPCFRVPANNIQDWKKVISKANKQMTNVKFVCANHFLPTDLISNYSVPQDIIEEVSDELFSLNDVMKNKAKVFLTEGWSIYCSLNEISFYKPNIDNGKLQIEKQIIFKNTLEINFFVYQYIVHTDNLGTKLQYPLNPNQITAAIKLFENKTICSGGPNPVNFPDLKKRCNICDKLFPFFRIYKQRYQTKIKSYIGPTLTPTRRGVLKSILSEKKNLKNSNVRFQSTIKKLQNSLSQSKNKMQLLVDDKINQILNAKKFSDSQKIIVREIIKGSKVANKKNNQYSEDWILLCVLLKIRSSSTYSFLRQQEILQLPCPRTIRKYLSLVKTQCGFDDTIFRLMKKKLTMLKLEQKFGMLVYDGIFLREILSVNSQTLTYAGLEDFGGEFSPSDLKANHVLAQLVVKAICLLENVGAKVLGGVVSDGATNNRKLWSELSISEQRENIKNKFDHPLDKKRKIFLFSDALHLIKNVRNKLFNKMSVRVSPTKPYIRWSHYIDVHKNDIARNSNAPTKVFPKITLRHLNPDSFSKMNVKLEC